MCSPHFWSLSLRERVRVRAGAPVTIIREVVSFPSWPSPLPSPGGRGGKGRDNLKAALRTTLSLQRQLIYFLARRSCRGVSSQHNSPAPGAIWLRSSTRAAPPLRNSK